MKVLRSTTFLALAWPALAWWTIVLSCILLSAFDPFADRTLSAEAIAALIVTGVLCGVYAVRAWRHKRWAAVAVNLSVIALNLPGLLD